MDEHSRDGADVGGSEPADAVLREFAAHPYQALDADGEICQVNDAWLDVLGYDRGEVVGERFGALLVGDSTAQFESRFEDLVETASVSGVDLEAAHAEGHAVSLRLGGRAEFDEDGDLHRAHCQFYDVTDCRDREVERREFREAVEQAAHAIYITDADGVIEYVNPAFEEVTGYDAAEAVGETPRILKSGAYDEAYYQELWDTILDGERWHGEMVDQTSEGERIVLDQTIAPISTEDGELCGFVAVNRDVTARKARERELERLTEEFDAILENAEDAVFLVDVEQTDDDVEFRFERLSPSHEAKSGLSTAAVRGKTPAEAFGAEVGDEIAANYRECVERREPITYEEVLPMPEGRIVWETILAPVVIDGTVTRIVGIARDVTDQRERQQTLHRYERLVENLPIGVYQSTTDDDGEFRLLNDAMVDLFGAESKAALREHAIRDLYANPEKRDAFLADLLEAGVVRDRELELQTLSGDVIWGSVTAIAGEVDGEPVFDGAIQDITARKEYERRVETQRDNLNLLNQVLRHDIRNDLQLVLAYVDLVHESVEGDERAHLETVLESARHAVELTTTARDMADVMLSTDEDRQPVGLRPALEGELDEIRSIYSDAVITVDGTIPAVTVRADDMLDSVFRNVLKNAIQHNDEPVPEVVVSTRVTAESVEVSVADNGPGVPDAQKAEIFGKGEKGLDSTGTGIGLYLVQTLVDTYGGSIRIEDNEPKGAVFTLTLPLAE